jgi:hypothetical protein
VKVVILILTVWNTANGDKLFELSRAFDGFSISGNRVEECRRLGMREAHKLTDQYRSNYPDASTNVDCHWVTRPGVPA